MAAAAIMLGACDKDVFDINTDPFKDEVYSTALTSPIASFLEEQEGYSEYVKVLNYSNMYNALNQSSSGTSFTAFVPNDEAMREFYQRRGVDSLQQLSKEYLRQFVLYHTVKDSILPESFVQKKTVQNQNFQGLYRLQSMLKKSVRCSGNTTPQGHRHLQ